MNKYTSRIFLGGEGGEERLQQLLLRVRLVIKEAGLWYITKLLYSHIAAGASGNHINVQDCTGWSNKDSNLKNP
jgi:hypothetical protein